MIKKDFLKVEVLLIILLFFFSFSFSFSFAGWYGAHTKSTGGGVKTSCDSDGDMRPDGSDYPDIDFEPKNAGTQKKDYIVDADEDNDIDSHDYVSENTSKVYNNGGGNITCYYRDGVDPHFSNLNYVKLGGESPGNNLLANDNFSLELGGIDNLDYGGAEVDKIEYKTEKNNNSDTLSSWGNFCDPCSNTEDEGSINFSNVDLDRDTGDGGREFSIVLKITDKAGNFEIKTYEWNVYANTPVNYENGTGFPDFANSYTGDNKAYFSDNITLEDDYGNEVVPAAGINRNIKFEISYNNDVYLNQYDEDEGSGIRTKFSSANTSDVRDNSNYPNSSYSDFQVGDNKTYSYIYDHGSFDYNDFNDGEYGYRIKSYVPTNDGYDKAYGRFNFKELKYTVDDDKLNVSNTFSPSTNFLKFTPAIKTKINDIPPIALEGTDKRFETEINKKSSNYDDFNFLIKYYKDGEPIDTYMKQDGVSNREDEYLFGKKDSKLGKFSENSNWNKTISSLSTSYDFWEKFELQRGETLDAANPGFIATHIATEYSDGTKAVWNSDIVGQNNYNYNVSSEELVSQNTVDIGGSVSSDFEDINQIMEGSVRTIGGKISKPELRSKITQMAYKLKRSFNDINYSPGGETVNLSNLPSSCSISSDCFEYRGTKVFYYEGDGGEKVVIDGNNSLDEKVLIVLEGGVDLYIKDDIETESNGMLGIISLNKDSDSARGNVYVKNEITNLDSYIYTNRAVIAYGGNPSSPIVQNELNQEELKHQLLINGVVRSFNTIGASKQDPPECPYFDDNSCDRIKAKKYDLEYTRRFFLVKASVYEEGADDKAWIPYDSSYSVGSLGNTELVGGVKCMLKDIDGDAQVEVRCKDGNSNLNEQKLSTPVDNPFGGDGNDITKEDRRKASSLIIDYNSKFKSEYLPIFSDL